jgi:drug/metabolite transporter (DMT)-like permease
MSPPRDEQGRGLALVLASTLAYGAMPIFGKIAYGSGVTAAPLLAWRFAIATALFATLSWRRRRPLPWRDHAILWGLGCVFVGNAITYFEGLESVPASTAALLVYTYPVIVTLLAGFFGLDRFTLRSLLSALLAFAGCALTAGSVKGGGPGVWLVLASAFVYSTYMLLGSRFAAGLPAEAMASHTAQAAAVLCIPWAALRGELWLPAEASAWAAVFAIAAVSTVIALRALLAGMALVGPVRAAVVSSFEVVVTLTLAAVFLGERIGARQLMGAVLIVGAVVLQNLGALRRLAFSRRGGAETRS